MKHDELLATIHAELATNYADECGNFPIGLKALRAVVELHKPIEGSIYCELCISSDFSYPCPTIQAIEKELM